MGRAEQRAKEAELTEVVLELKGAIADLRIEKKAVEDSARLSSGAAGPSKPITSAPYPVQPERRGPRGREARGEVTARALLLSPIRPVASFYALPVPRLLPTAMIRRFEDDRGELGYRVARIFQIEAAIGATGALLEWTWRAEPWRLR